MGLKTSPRFFQSVIHRVFEGVVNKSPESYQDDTLLKAKSFDGALAVLRSALERVQAHKLKLRLTKCKFMYK